MDSILRDINREQGKMEADFSNLQRHGEKLYGYVHQYIEQTTIEWARLIESHPKALLLIVETTRVVDEHGSTFGESEPIRFTGVPVAGGEVWDHLIHPTHSAGVHGYEYHSLAWSDLKDKPRLADAWPIIAERLKDRHIVIFGADWARNALRGTHYTHELDSAFCLHSKCKEYYNEFYELSLQRVLEYQGINKTREQLTDSRVRILMLAQVVHNLAKGLSKQIPETEVSDDLDEHPF